MIVQPYVFFDGRCEEAIAFYQKALGAKVEMLMRFKENPEPPTENCAAPGADDKVMHACIRIGETSMMLSDGMNMTGKPAFEGFSLSLTVKTEAEAKKLFAALGDGGTVCVPLNKTFFSPSFGMINDRFGVSWMVVVMP